VTYLAAVAATMVAPGKGILAADESTSVMFARLKAASIKPAPGTCRTYREMLISTPGLARGISGVVLSPETAAQQLADGTLFPQAIRQHGMLPGVRGDGGAGPLAGCPGETITRGLDGLAGRLRRYARAGAAFAIWRAGLRIGPGLPSETALRANAQVLARFAATCQEAGLVPVVAPGVAPDGPHSLSQCETVTSLALLHVVLALEDDGIALDAVVLTPAMVQPGHESGEPASPADVASATMASLNSVPAALAGVAFSAAGQRPPRATANLAELQSGLHVWPLTFCFGQALDDAALAAWHGSRAGAGQRALIRRVAMNTAALEGRYTAEPECEPVQGYSRT
jgi:fructose-bisphosphate aldolase, class I